MIQRIFQYAWQARREFAKYFAVGITTVVLDLGSLVLLKEKFAFSPVWAVVVNQVLVIAFNFTSNKYWSFGSKQYSHSEAFRYLALTIFNYGFAVITMYVCNSKLGYDYRLIRIATIAVVVCWNFLLYKHWVYRQEQK